MRTRPEGPELEVTEHPACPSCDSERVEAIVELDRAEVHMGSLGMIHKVKSIPIIGLHRHGREQP